MSNARETLYVGAELRILIQSGLTNFTIDSSPATNVTITDLNGNVLAGPDTAVTDVTYPADPNAPNKTLAYTLPSDIEAMQARATLIFYADGQSYTYVVDLDIQDYPLLTPPMGVHGFPPIYVAFSEPLDPEILTLANGLNVWAIPMIDYVGRKRLAGAWSISTQGMKINGQAFPAGAVAVFEPSIPMPQNYRFVVSIGVSVYSLDGSVLSEPMEYHFFSKLNPLYIDPYQIKLRLEEYADKVSDEEIFLHGWEASKECNREVMRFVPNYLVAGPTEQQVVDWSMVTRTYAMNKFTEIETIIRILRAMRTRMVSEVDRKHQGLDFSTEIQTGLIGNLEKSIKAFIREREQYYSEISFKKPRVTTTSKSGNYPGSRQGQRIVFPRRQKF